ncbi:TPA: hypothetical protein ACGO32_000642 [Streptococcus suis]
MIDNNDVSKVEHDSIKIDVDSLTNLPEKNRIRTKLADDLSIDKFA